MAGIWMHKDGKYFGSEYFGFYVVVSKRDGYGWEISDVLWDMVGGKFFKTAKDAMAFAEEHYA